MLDGCEYLRAAYLALLRGRGTVEEFVVSFADFLAEMPYDITNDNERHYQAMLYALLLSFGADVVVEQRTARGRIDVALRLPQAVYIFELKYVKPRATKAVAQTVERGYAAPYRHGGRPVYAVGITISGKCRTVKETSVKQIG